MYKSLGNGVGYLLALFLFLGMAPPQHAQKLQQERHQQQQPQQQQQQQQEQQKRPEPQEIPNFGDFLNNLTGRTNYEKLDAILAYTQARMDSGLFPTGEYNPSTIQPRRHMPIRCPMVGSLTVDFRCFNLGTEMDCPKHLPYGSVITSTCKSGYHNPSDDLEELTCGHGGSWDKSIPDCKPVDSGTTAQGTGNAGVIGCVLPPYPRNGKYIVERLPDIRPGMVLEQFLYMKYSCNKKYDISGSAFVECGETNQWSPIPSCHKKCRMPTSYSVNFTCRSASIVIICKPHVPHGTEIQSTCKREFDPLNDLHPIKCQDGLWNELPPSCRAICGLEHPIGVELVANGTIVTNHAFPWHVGVYQAYQGRFEHNCGGTILYPNLIVSAAHCFYDGNGQIEANYFRIAAGKTYRSYDNAVDDAKRWVQKREVDKIHLPVSYRGRESLHQSDIALVELKIPLEFSGFVRPICFDLNDPGLNTFQLRAGNIGKVAGWGLTENGTTSEELRVLRMPVIDIIQCGEEVAKYSFLGFLSSDKLCAGYTTGAAVCQGDSGGGLVFSETRGGVEKWHLRAVVSVSPVQTNLNNKTTCRFDTYSAFSEVYKHRDWMIQILRNLKLLN